MQHHTGRRTAATRQTLVSGGGSCLASFRLPGSCRACTTPCPNQSSTTLQAAHPATTMLSMHTASSCVQDCCQVCPHLQVVLFDEGVHLLTLRPLLAVSSVLGVDHATHHHKVDHLPQPFTAAIPGGQPGPHHSAQLTLRLSLETRHLQQVVDRVMCNAPYRFYLGYVGHVLAVERTRGVVCQLDWGH